MTESTTPQLTESEVAEIEARANAASSGPWLVTDGQHIDQYDHHPDGNRLLSEGSYDANYHMFGTSDVEFIAHARTDIPALIRDWRALTAQLGVATDLCNVATESLKKSEAENAALREQLAQAENERDAAMETLHAMTEAQAIANRKRAL